MIPDELIDELALSLAGAFDIEEADLVQLLLNDDEALNETIDSSIAELNLPAHALNGGEML